MRLKSFKIISFFSCVLVLTLLAPIRPVQAATLTVSKTADTNDGACNADCSLREAITAAVASDAIHFNIPSATDAGCNAGTGVCTITPTLALPSLTDAGLVINGYSQTGASANTNDFPSAINAVIKIVINGTGLGAGVSALTISNVANVVIQGVAITNFTNYGIVVTGAAATGAKIQGCFIGTDATGEIVSTNAASGIIVNTSATQAIIGTNGDGANDAAERNLISGNTAQGVYLNSGTQNRVAGNFIGTDKDGTTDLGNVVNGVRIAAGSSSDTVGTNGDGVYDAGEGNLISGNNSSGVVIASNSNVIAGNRIGVNASGTDAISNTSYGVLINAGDNMRIGTNGDGTSDDLERNIISGHSVSPTRAIWGVGSGTIVAGNYIGVDSTGDGRPFQ